MNLHCTWKLCAYIMLPALMSGPVNAASPVYTTNPRNPQRSPDIDNGVVVWAEQVDGDWDVYGLDLFKPDGSRIPVAAYFDSDQDQPAIWSNRVVYQDNFFGDWDVYVSDISDANVPVDYSMTLAEQDYLNDQIAPAIHGNTAVWQSYVSIDDGQGGTIEDWDIVAADITEPNNSEIYLVQLADYDQYFENQQAPAIYRNRIVWQDQLEGIWDIATTDFWLRDIALDGLVSATDFQQENPAVWGDWVVWQEDIGSGDYNIYAADISDPTSPGIIALTADPAAQTNPDISGHIVVWQDDRNGNWDIYGYNRITQQEFQITTDTSDQTEPAVSGSLVVWTDARDNPSQIYYAVLDPVIAADCPSPLAGDINGDCRVDLADYARLAQDWLLCNRDPVAACF